MWVRIPHPPLITGTNVLWHAATRNLGVLLLDCGICSRRPSEAAAGGWSRDTRGMAQKAFPRSDRFVSRPLPAHR